MFTLAIPFVHGQESALPSVSIPEQPAGNSFEAPAVNKPSDDSIFFAEKINVRGVEPVDSETSDAVADDNGTPKTEVTVRDMADGMARVKKLRTWGTVMAASSAVCIAGGIYLGLFGLVEVCMTSGDPSPYGIASIIAGPVLMSGGLALGILSYTNFKKAKDLKLSLKPGQLTDLSFTGKNRVTPALTISLSF